MSEIVFFDDQCGLCKRSVNGIVGIDLEKRFLFAPLSGKTAEEKVPKRLRGENTLVLVEEKRVWVRGRAVFRILWLIGGKWKLLGWLAWLPVGVDMVYRVVARYRHWIGKDVELQVDRERLLP